MRALANSEDLVSVSAGSGESAYADGLISGIRDCPVKVMRHLVTSRQACSAVEA